MQDLHSNSCTAFLISKYPEISMLKNSHGACFTKLKMLRILLPWDLSNAKVFHTTACTIPLKAITGYLESVLNLKTHGYQ